MPSDSSGKEKTVHLVVLMNGSTEYQTVLNMFQKTGGRGQIVKIERIQNPHLYQQYMVRKRKMDKDNRGMNNERQLFHGTAEKNLNEINTTGYNRSFSGINGESVFSHSRSLDNAVSLNVKINMSFSYLNCLIEFKIFQS
jgi:hypothetical protein